ncbi:GNAT family N-acetyltransferase [Aneurinibacillus migulanus]|uniref:GNAT family N-acetyltransferase n=1 Tax=Aneurinibacillus migulanus TaxID=47500 RepID=UPI001F2BB693|nr:GNAT family N-acetyltransferase [Aneurinibacillus migulanus]
MNKKDVLMIRITSKIISPSVRELLSYATSEAKIDQEYEQYVQASNRILYGFENAGIMVGCIGVEFLNASDCEIKHIAVSPTERGNGIGSKMVQFICEKHSLRNIFAETDKDAVDFYRKFRFKIISLGEKYPGVERFFCEYEIPNK